MGLHINNLSHHVGERYLLEHITAHIEQPALIGVIGPNGAGKSTLLNCMTGLLPTSGCIQLNGQPLESYRQAGLAAVRAVLAQENHLNFPFLARDIVGMSFAFSALSIQQQEQLMSDCLDVVSAGELAGRSFLSLSGGEKQRIHIARVLAQLLQHNTQHHLRYLFLDEPTAPLDLKHQLQLFAHLQQLKQHNICIITVIHDINLAASCCDELWVMHEGRLTKRGTPQQVVSKALMRDVFEANVNISLMDDKPVIHPVASFS